MNLYSTLEHLCPVENRRFVKIMCESVDANIKQIEQETEACITVLVSPEPLTPIQSHYIQAILENKEFNSGENKK